MRKEIKNEEIFYAMYWLKIIIKEKKLILIGNEYPPQFYWNTFRVQWKFIKLPPRVE